MTEVTEGRRVTQPQPLGPVLLGNVIPPMLPAQFTTDVLDGPDGSRAVLVKLAVPGCCVTAIVAAADARRWVDQFDGHVRHAETGLVRRVGSGLILP